MPEPLETRRYRVTGRVQGVGFRFYTMREAERIGVTGWVRNRPDRSVEAVAQGSPEQIADFEAALARGPRFSRVDAVDGRPCDSGAGEFARFDIRRDG